jgi:hypothetical protein
MYVVGQKLLYLGTALQHSVPRQHQQDNNTRLLACFVLEQHSCPACCHILLLLLLLLLLPVGLPQVIVTLDKGADGTLTQQQHGSLTTRIQPLTQTQDDKIWD